MTLRAITLVILFASAFSLIYSPLSIAQNQKSAQEPDNKADADKQAGSAKKESAEASSASRKKTVKHKHPAEAIEHYNRGVELHKAGFLNKAIFEYKEALKVDEQMEQAYSNLGLIYTAQKNWTKALEAFDTALKMKPDRTTSLNGLGTVLYAMKRVDEALEKWRKAAEIDPTFASAYYNMGNAYENEENYKEALNAYVKAVEVNPKMSDAYYRIGSLLNKSRHTAQAFVLLDKAVKMDPSAEFVKDARKQLSVLDKQFKESNTRDGGQAASENINVSAQSNSLERKVAQSSQPVRSHTTTGGAGNAGAENQRASDRIKPTKLIKSIFKRPGSTEGKKVDMFVQPPTESDLKAKPEQ